MGEEEGIRMGGIAVTELRHTKNLVLGECLLTIGEMEGMTATAMQRMEVERESGVVGLVGWMTGRRRDDLYLA
jgi:hypothetical protein